MTVSTVMLIAGVVLILTGCFELIRTRHMLKIIIALELAIKAVSMFLALGGWLNGNMPADRERNRDRSRGCHGAERHRHQYLSQTRKHGYPQPQKPERMRRTL